VRADVAPHDVHGVPRDRLEGGEHVAHAAGRPGKVHDERAPTHAGHAATERGTWKVGAGDGTQPLGNAGRLAIERDAGCLGGDVARAQSRAAGGEHEIGDVAVAPGDELAHDGDDVVAHDRSGHDGPTDGGHPCRSGVARAVGPLAPRRGVGDGEHGDAKH
jgi:hypothetical protein